MGLSYRGRLTLFFVLIVALPMITLAVLVTQIASDSADGKTDARISAGLRTATSLFETEQAKARAAAKQAATEIAADPSSAKALAQGDTVVLTELVRTLRTRDHLVTVVITDSAGATARAKTAAPVATGSADLHSSPGNQIGTISVSTISPAALLERIESTTGERAALLGPSRRITGTASIEAGALTDDGEATDLDRDGEDLRVAATEPLGDEQTRIAIAAPQADEGFFASRPRLGVALLAFFAAALLAIGYVVRTLRGQVTEMLAAARRLGEGDFSRQVPVSGSDEMAGLATEFNKMSDRLREQMDQLGRQRLEIERSVGRVGEAFASGLDRRALLAILVEAAAGACEAEYGLIALSGHVGPEAEWGEASEAVSAVALSAEARALREPGLIDEEHGGAYALSSSLGPVDTSGDRVGVLTVARQRPFDSSERKVFLYLLVQAASSVENVTLHELVSAQAVTDDLTGLPNKRAFRDVMNKEAARAARFGHALSFVIADLDDFKRVNDIYGHLQGDAVLRVIGRIFADESRGIDVPARYGGEEFVIALPETATPGALEVAERIRSRVAAEAIPLIGGDGTIRVTASLGVATLPGTAADLLGLIASADAALYEAKATGKNRVVVGIADGDAGAPSGQRHASDIADKGRAPARRK